VIGKEPMRAHVSTFRSDERGAALIELAVVLPVLLTISLGVFQFSYLIYNYHLITVGVRDAARYAAGLTWSTQVQNDAICIALTGGVSGGNCTATSSPSCTTACRVSWGDNAGLITITHDQHTDNGSICGTAGTPAYCRGRDANGKIWTVTVTADISYNSTQAVNFLSYLGLNPPSISISHEERDYNVR
jgi:Flp pilus assembly protein TadG